MKSLYNNFINSTTIL